MNQINILQNILLLDKKLYKYQNNGNKLYN